MKVFFSLFIVLFGLTAADARAERILSGAAVAPITHPIVRPRETPEVVSSRKLLPRANRKVFPLSAKSNNATKYVAAPICNSNAMPTAKMTCGAVSMPIFARPLL
jgi:hypothetical protein